MERRTCWIRGQTKSRGRERGWVKKKRGKFETSSKRPGGCTFEGATEFRGWREKVALV